MQNKGLDFLLPLLRISPYEVLTAVFLFKKDFKGVFFIGKTKKKSRISI